MEYPAAPDLEARTTASPTAKTCDNCRAALVEPYCHQCGQRALEGRLHFRELFHGFTSRYLSLGLLKTVWQMVVRPGIVIKRYLDGQRRAYANPITYLVFSAALSILAFELVEAEFRVWMESLMESQADVYGFTSAQEEAFYDLNVTLAQFTVYVTLVACLPFAAFLRFLFRKTGVALVETIVFAIFAYSHVNIVGALLTPPMAKAGMLSLVTAFIYVLYTAVGAQAADQFFDRRWGTAVKAGVASLASAILAYMAISMASSPIPSSSTEPRSAFGSTTD